MKVQGLSELQHELHVNYLTMHRTLVTLYGIIPMGKNRYITVLNPDGACMSNYRQI